MSSNAMRALAGVAVVIVAIALLLILKNDDGDNSSGGGTPAAKNAAPVPTIVIKGGKPVGGIMEISVEEGEKVRFKVDSDVSDEVHVHGYDIAMDVEAGGSVSFEFPATIEGVFEAELESRKEQILELRVNP